MDISALVEAVQEGRPQPPEKLATFVAGVAEGSVSRADATTWLKAVHAHGCTQEDKVQLTTSMIASGERLKWNDGPPVVDKHSTGGVGDKMSLILAPALAACGCRVPMLAGRGLGHTGGTIDKLEALGVPSVDEGVFDRAEVHAEAALTGPPGGGVARADVLLGDHQQRRQVRVASRGLDDGVETLGLLGQDGHLTGGLGLQHAADTVRLTLLLAADLLGLGFGQGLDPLLLDLGGHHDVGELGGLFALGALGLGDLLGGVGLGQGLRGLDLLGGLGLAAFIWAVRTGQFDDMDGAAQRILIDDDDELD